MKLINLILFEIKFQLKQRAFIGFSIVFLYFGYLVSSQGSIAQNLDFNSAYEINNKVVLLSLGAVFAIMFFAVSGLLREKQHKMEALIYSSPISKKDFFISRFSGVVIPSIIVFSLSLLGLYLGFNLSDLNPERLHSFQSIKYIQSWAIFVLPNVFICTSIIASISILTKNNLATYVSAIAIYTSYFLCAMFFNSPIMANAVSPSPENMMVASLLDPFGISAFYEQTLFWTPTDKNSKMISFSNLLLFNRLLWMAIAYVFMYMSYRLFSFKQGNRKVKKEKVEQSYTTAKKYKSLQPQLGFLTSFKSFISVLKLELKSIIRSTPFLVILLLWILVFVMEVYSRIYSGGSYNESLYPATNTLIEIVEIPLQLLSLILIVFYSGEVIWRENSDKINQLVYTTPASNVVFFMAKYLSVFLLPLILFTVSIVGAIVFQVIVGYDYIEIDLYLNRFYFVIANYLFYLFLAFFIQSVSSNKYLGMAISGLCIIIFATPLSGMIGLELPILKLGKLPKVGHSDLYGYTDNLKMFNYYALVWMVLGGLLAVLSFKLWKRGVEFDFQQNKKLVRKKWSTSHKFAVGFLSVLFIISIGGVYYNTHIVTSYMNAEEDLDLRENYERTYKKYDVKRQLIPRELKFEVDLYPAERGYQVVATCVLENKGEQPLKELLISEVIPVEYMRIEGAVLKKHDSLHNVRIYEFKEELKHGETINYKYSLEYKNKGFETSRSIVKNGSFINRDYFDPALGYSSGYEIQNTQERKKRGLPIREEHHDEAHMHLKSEHYEKLVFETIISTQSDQVAIAPGELIKEWKQEERNYYHYKVSKKEAPFIAFISGDYELKKDDFQGVQIENYYHANHSSNISDIEHFTKETIGYCQDNFGEFPSNHVRIAEIPNHFRFGGIAFPGTIVMVEDNLYSIDNRETDFDVVAKRTIHEVAHQYWGHNLTPNNVDGGGILTEGLCKYTEAIVMEKLFGKQILWQLNEQANNRYFSGRSYATEEEVPIYLENGQGHLIYGKACMAFTAVKELIGTEMLNKSIKTLLDTHKNETKPSVTSHDLIKAMYATTPEKYHKLIDDWFKRIITYDLTIEKVESKKLKSNEFETTLIIKAKRFEEQVGGNMLEIDIDEPIQIGVFNDHPSIATTKDVLHLEHHLMNKSRQEIKIVTKEKPFCVAIDPYGTRVEERRVDNIKNL
ncbi:ABC-type transport system involved in multi-copper enzyme maturation, permease component [Tenacibaculum sp. MAR_2009_124]|uniref:ABC transporter permease/M1 family aminopeptidase n=1 Tax=Tenacibaculum sp. MAR_2009_124 TaxID=1250059 RepID=UPI000895BB3D|nr:M1 family aminopeptidase [Tenacibaculum sp. MAR_2009_124]SEB45123.1 ABC-type transport system involved in multi-copper enzyme maturation, permease component [Tenacibaculum sp. MAR_2009_124]